MKPACYDLKAEAGTRSVIGVRLAGLVCGWLRRLRLLLPIITVGASAVSLEVNVAPRFNGRPMAFDSLTNTTAAGELISVTRLDLLLSDLAIRRLDGTWIERKNWQAFLSLGGGRSGFRVEGISAGSFDQLRFRVGISKELNHSDSTKHAADHPLNPNLNGLHWSWQGGYIFMALEGRWNGAPSIARPDAAQSSDARRSTAAGNGYSLHFANDWNLTTVTLPATFDLSRDAALQLDLDLAELLRGISFAKDGTSTHSREGDPIAAALMKNYANAFRVAPLRKDELRESPISSNVSGPDGTRVASPSGNALPRYLPAKFTPYRFTMSSVFPVPDLPKDNPLIEERVALGRALFREKKLSRDNSIACASCHVENAGFSDSRRYSLGVAGRPGTRQAMPLFNLAWKSSFFWDGRAPSLRAQALVPIQDHLEMDEKLERVVEKLGRSRRKEALTKNSELDQSVLTSAATQDENYPALFTAAFGSPEITPEKIGLALENFLITLTSFDSKFDRAHRGEPGVMLTEQEQRGFELFFTEYDPRREQFGADCFHCHGGANFSMHGFANNGLDELPANPGRFAVSHREADRGKFSVPSLRNVAVTAPYMHDGRFATLEEVVAHYSNGVKRSVTLDPNLAKHPDGGLNLSAADQAALVAFLRSLTDERYVKAAPGVTTSKR